MEVEARTKELVSMGGGLLGALGAAIKGTIGFPFKLLIAVLNVIPSRIYETHPHPGYANETHVGVLREVLAQCRGRRRLGLGSALIAHQRGCVFDACGQVQGYSWRGVYPEDFAAIQSKWTF